MWRIIWAALQQGESGRCVLWVEAPQRGRPHPHGQPGVRLLRRRCGGQGCANAQRRQVCLPHSRSLHALDCLSAICESKREVNIRDADISVWAYAVQTSDAQGLSCRVERGATPRRLASELGSQANSMSAVPPLPSSMLRFSGQQPGQQPAKTPAAAEQPERVTFEEPVQSKAASGTNRPADLSQQQQQQKQRTPPPALQLPAVAASIGAGAAGGMAAARPLAAEVPDHDSKVICCPC